MPPSRMVTPFGNPGNKNNGMGELGSGSSGHCGFTKADLGKMDLESSLGVSTQITVEEV